MKHCNKCKTDLKITLFYKDKSRRDGHSPYCKECMNKKYMKYYHKNREKIILKMKDR